MQGYVKGVISWKTLRPYLPAEWAVLLMNKPA